MSRLTRSPVALGTARVGAHVELGQYGRARASVSWRIMRTARNGALLLISDGVLMAKAFDATSPDGPDAGDNRWRDSTLRHWLNSSAPAGKVDFGPHPPPDAAHVRTAQLDRGIVAILKKAGHPTKRSPSKAYHREAGFLRAFSEAERACLAPVKLETKVCSGYTAKRKASVDRTTDTVFLLTWEEYAKLPKELKSTEPAQAFRDDDPEQASRPGHWSRSAIADLGVAVLETWNREMRRANSGAYCCWGVRPCIGVAAGTVVTGAGTAAKPFRIA
jgi:hypothetical protein